MSPHRAALTAEITNRRSTDGRRISRRGAARLLLLLFGAGSLGACSDASTAPAVAAQCTIDPPASLATSTENVWTHDDMAVVLADAAERLILTLGESAESAEVRTGVRELSAVWSVSTDASCRATLAASDALRRLPADPAIDADRSALRMVLDRAAAVISGDR